MKKKGGAGIIITVVIVVLVIVAAAGFFFIKKSGCSSLETSGNRDGCYYDEATISSNIKICDKIRNKYIKSDCYTKIALDTKDVNVCSIHPMKGFRGKENCYLELAVRTQDISICQYYSDYSANVGDGYCEVQFNIRTKDVD